MLEGIGCGVSLRVLVCWRVGRINCFTSPESSTLHLQAISAHMAQVKLSDLIPPYKDCETSGNFLEWCERLELVADLQGVANKEKFLPLFLQGAAFAVYKELSAATKTDFKRLKKQLATAFGTSSITAFEEFRARTLGQGESVDAYAADLRRLLTAVGVGEIPDPLLRAAFVAGLPVGCKEQVLMINGLDSMALDQLLAKTRTLLSAKSTADHGAAASAVSGRERRRPTKLTCHRCGKTGHLVRECRQEKPQVMCFSCNQMGHFSRNCPTAAAGASGNGEGESSLVQEASPLDQ